VTRRRAIAAALVASAALLAALLAGCGGGSSSSTTAKAGPHEPKRPLCTVTIGPEDNFSEALASAQVDAVVCLESGSYPETTVPSGATAKAGGTTIIQPAPGAKPFFGGELRFEGARNIRLDGISFRSGLNFSPEAENVEVLNNNLTGIGGIYFAGDPEQHLSCRHVLIEGNTIHDINYTGPQNGYQGYGIKAVGTPVDFTVRDNTIKSVAADYLQTDVAEKWKVEDNTFLGPSLVGTHPQEHQDLWQDYAGGKGMIFRDNIARHTGTAESLLFQLTYPDDKFSEVNVENNLFDHDSEGFSIQIYQVDGLTFTDNTLVGSNFGSVFRRDSRYPPGSGYKVEHNIFAETNNPEQEDLGIENGVEDWGTFDWNVSTDESATGPHSVRNWKARWGNEVDYPPLGLPIPAGFKPPSS
jgi:hypothetical protein